MNTVQRIARNTTLLYISRVVSTALRFILFIYIARILGDAVLGKLTFAIVFTTFFSIFISLGMDDLLVREVARDKADASKYLSNIATLRTGLSVLVFILIVAVISATNYPTDTKLAVAIFGGYAVFTSFTSLFRANFRAFESMEWDALVEITESITTASAGLIVLLSGHGLIELSLVFFAASLISFVISFSLCQGKFAKTRFRFDARFLITSLKHSIPLYVTMLYILYSRVDTLLLSAMKGDSVVGNYNAAYQIVLVFDQFVLTFMIAIVPVISRLYISSSVMLNLAYEKSFKYLIVLGLPISLGGAVLAHRIIPFLYGSEFKDSVLALQVLIWNCLLLCMNRPMLFMLGAINRQGTGAIIGSVAIGASVAMNFIAIPRWSYLGSGAVSLAVGGLVTAASWYAIYRYAYRLSIFKILLKPMVASITMGIGLYLFDIALEPNLFALVFIGTGIYLSLLYLMKVFSTDDQILFRQAVRVSGASREVSKTI